VRLFDSEHKQKDRLAAVSPKSDQVCDQAAAIAEDVFRFLRLPSRPNAPRPPANNGRVAGIGVAVGLIAKIRSFQSSLLAVARSSAPMNVQAVNPPSALMVLISAVVRLPVIESNGTNAS